MNLDKTQAREFVNKVCDDYIIAQLRSMGIERKKNKNGKVYYEELKEEDSNSRLKKVEETKEKILELLDVLRSDYFGNLCDSIGCIKGSKLIKQLNDEVHVEVNEFKAWMYHLKQM